MGRTEGCVAKEEKTRRSLPMVLNRAGSRRSPDDVPRRRGSCGSPGRDLGVGTESASPKTLVLLASAALAPVLLSGLLLIVFVPELWWIFTTYGWISFPALGLLARGLIGMSAEPSGKQKALASAESKERELLVALAEHEELTPARAATETSLTVAEVDGRLKELAEGGHLEVRVRGGGGLFYALWKSGRDEEAGEPDR